MHLIADVSARLPHAVIRGQAQYRHKVFVQTLHWNLPCRDGIESDQFDRQDTVYVVALDDDDEVVGTARLLPTTRPYLLSEVFPGLLGGQPPPCSPEVWELSRFAAVDFAAKTRSAATQFSAPTASALLRAALDVAASHGAQRLVTVSPVGVERLLRNAGFAAKRMAPAVTIGGQALVSIVIEVEA